MPMHDYDVIVLGAGMVGASIGYGLTGHGKKVLLLDGADTDFRAAKANFGLVWVQGKGLGDPAYQQLTIDSARGWPQLAEQLKAETDIDVAYENNGGLVFCLSEKEFSTRAGVVHRWNAQSTERIPRVRMVERDELQRRFPTMRLGVDVVGASLGDLDGQANPLKLLAALQIAYLRRGGELRSNHTVTGIVQLPGGGFEVTGGAFRVRGERIVIAAGHGCADLGPMVGLTVPMRPQRGQLLVTERLEPLLPLANSGIRQTAEGTVMIGTTHEEVGFDISTTVSAASRMAARAVRILPDLAKARLVRQWSALRVMTPDGGPVFANSVTHPGAAIVVCHSGVTLAAFLAADYANGMALNSPPNLLNNFHYDRFNVQKAA